MFTKNMRELDNKRENNQTSNPETNMTTNSTNHVQPSTSKVGNANWVKFTEEGDSSTKTGLRQSFEDNFSTDLGVTSKMDDDSVEPRPLFNTSQVNNNVTYSYDLLDAPVTIGTDPDVFVPTPILPRNNFRQHIDCFKRPTFYQSLVTLITAKFSEFVFYTLFPSFLYVRLDSLKVHHVSSLVGYLAIAGLLFTIISAFINVHVEKQTITLWTFCWCGSFGYLCKAIM